MKSKFKLKDMSLSIKKSRTPLLTTALSSSYRLHPKQINSTTAKWYNLIKQIIFKNNHQSYTSPNIVVATQQHSSFHLSPSRSFWPRNDLPRIAPMPTRTAHWQLHGPIRSRSRGPAVPLPWEIGSRCGSSNSKLVPFFQDLYRYIWYISPNL